MADPITSALKAVLEKLKGQQQPQRDTSIPPGFGRPDPFAPTAPPSIPVDRPRSQWNADNWLQQGMAQEAARRAQQVSAQAAPNSDGGAMFTSSGGGGGFSAPPRAPAYPQEPAYQRPAPIFSESDFQRQMESDFSYARRAADVAVNNQLRLAGGSQRDLIGAQFAGQRSLMDTQATNQLRTAGGTQRDLIGAQFAGQRSLMGGSQLDLMNAQAANQIRAMGGTQRQLLGDQFTAASNATQQQADLNLRNQSALMAQAGNAQISATRAAPRKTTMVGGNTDPRLAQALANERAQLEFERTRRERDQLKRSKFDGGATPSAAPIDPSVQLQRDRISAQQQAQAADIAARERMQAADLAGRERLQAADAAARAALAVQAGQNRQTEIRTQGETEDELRRKAAMRALETFSNANPRGRQLSLSNSGRVA